MFLYKFSMMLIVDFITDSCCANQVSQLQLRRLEKTESQVQEVQKEIEALLQIQISVNIANSREELRSFTIKSYKFLRYIYTFLQH